MTILFTSGDMSYVYELGMDSVYLFQNTDSSPPPSLDINGEPRLCHSRQGGDTENWVFGGDFLIDSCMSFIIK